MSQPVLRKVRVQTASPTHNTNHRIFRRSARCSLRGCIASLLARETQGCVHRIAAQCVLALPQHPPMHQLSLCCHQSVQCCACQRLCVAGTREEESAIGNGAFASTVEFNAAVRWVDGAPHPGQCCEWAGGAPHPGQQYSLLTSVKVRRVRRSNGQQESRNHAKVFRAVRQGVRRCHAHPALLRTGGPSPALGGIDVH